MGESADRSQPIITNSEPDTTNAINVVTLIMIYPN